MSRLFFTKPHVRPFWPEHVHGNFLRRHGKMASQIYVNIIGCCAHFILGRRGRAGPRWPQSAKQGKSVSPPNGDKLTNI